MILQLIFLVIAMFLFLHCLFSGKPMAASKIRRIIFNEQAVRFACYVVM